MNRGWVGAVAHRVGRVALLVSLVVAAGCTDETAPRYPSTPATSAALNDGAAAMGQFEFAQAGEAFTKALAADPSDPYARLDAAIARMNSTDEGAQSEAIALLAPLTGDPFVGTRALYCTAMAQLFLGDPAAALGNLRKVEAAQPDDAYAHYYAGQCLELADKPQEAAAEYERALALTPLLRSAHLGLQRIAERSGRSEEAAKHLAEFDALSNNPRSTIAQFKYTRMGPLADVCLPRDPYVPAGRWEVTGPQGVFGTQFPLQITGLPEGHKVLEIRSAVDLDGDGRTELIARALDSKPNSRLGSHTPLVADPDTTGIAHRWTAQPDHPLAQLGRIAKAVWGDLNNDGRVDAVIVPERPQRGELPEAPYWIEQVGPNEWPRRSFGDCVGVNASVLAIADFDHDGDLDVLISGEGSDSKPFTRICYNLANGEWTGVDLPTTPADPGTTRGAAPVDLDLDGDLDIITWGGHLGLARAQVFVNARLWSWRRDPARYGTFESRRVFHAVAWTDSDDGAPRVATLQFAPGHGTGPYQDLCMSSFGRDGVRELAREYFGLANWLAVADVSGTGRPSVLVGGNRLNQPFAFARKILDTTAIYSDALEFLGEVADAVGFGVWTPVPFILDGKGVVLAGYGGGIIPPGRGRGTIATVALRGRIDPSQQLRTNASGIGARALGRVGDRFVAGQQLPWSTFNSQGTDPCVVGLGSAKDMDFLTIDWPDGVLQTEGRIGAGATTVVETQRQISSCPVVFAWNGQEMAFVTDSLGVGGLGYLAGISSDPATGLSAVYAPPRPDERIAIPADAIASREGRYEIALSEPMEEMTALDAATLTVVDLPPGWQMALDERMGINDPQPTGEPIYWRQSVEPSRTSVRHGECEPRDATRACARADGIAIDPGPIDARFIGRTESPFAVVLEFPQPLNAFPGDPVLLMDGWIEYPYCQTNFAMWQAKAPLSPPTFEALDPRSGEWKTIVREYGYPAGMPREAAFPLPRESIPEDCRSLRITTNHELYFDRLRVVFATPCPEAIVRTIPAASARVLASGFARRTTQAQRRPHYDYSDRLPLWDCKTQRGWYTALAAECRELVAERDDAVAIFGGGEEVRLTFDAIAQPPSEGWSRAFVLNLAGWCKDMDLLTGDGETVGPLPRRDAAQPEAPQRDALHRRFNTRYEGGR